MRRSFALLDLLISPSQILSWGCVATSILKKYNLDTRKVSPLFSHKHCSPCWCIHKAHLILVRHVRVEFINWRTDRKDRQALHHRLGLSPASSTHSDGYTTLPPGHTKSNAILLYLQQKEWWPGQQMPSQDSLPLSLSLVAVSAGWSPAHRLPTPFVAGSQKFEDTHSQLFFRLPTNYWVSLGESFLSFLGVSEYLCL